MNSDRVFWIGVLLACIVGFGLRCYGIWENEFWTDELVAIRTSHTMGSIGDHCFQRFSSPPLRYLLTWVFLDYFHEDRLIRIPSLVAGTLAILLTALLARRWFGNGAGFWASWAVSLNPWMIAYSQDGRMHIVAMFFFLCSIYLAIPLPTRWKRLTLFLGGFCLALSSAITYAAVIVCFGGLLVVMLESLGPSRKEWAVDVLTFTAPWGVWMFSWLALLWVMTSPIWQPPPPPPEENPIEVTQTVDSEPESTIEPLPPPPRRPMPLFNPYFYRESIANIWDDQPLKFLFLLGTLLFVIGKGTFQSPGRGSRFALFAIPILLILILQPHQFYRRYLLSLLPFPLIGIGILGTFFDRKLLGTLVFGLALAAMSLHPTYWVLTHSPQPWKSATEYLEENVKPGDHLMMGSHQAEFAASYYMVGKVPTWDIVYYSMVEGKFMEMTKKRGTSWFVQWFGISPQLEQRILEFYDKVEVYPGRFGQIVVFKEKDSVEEETAEDDE
ncbi:MAG: glycosyltransferase family 39 protein [Candidatus Omnitrophica bacterium]|nr:glycosyltransferase family 39 protein [Candidatus Omnitrophota bacterium]